MRRARAAPCTCRAACRHARDPWRWGRRGRRRGGDEARHGPLSAAAPEAHAAAARGLGAPKATARALACRRVRVSAWARVCGRWAPRGLGARPGEPRRTGSGRRGVMRAVRAPPDRARRVSRCTATCACLPNIPPRQPPNTPPPQTTTTTAAAVLANGRRAAEGAQSSIGPGDQWTIGSIPVDHWLYSRPNPARLYKGSMKGLYKGAL